VLPYANTQTMALHLEAVSQAEPPGRHAVLVLDQAAWHTTPKLLQLPNVSLLSLPAGSPKLNPAEQVWQQLRDRSLANRCYGSYEHIIDACCEASNKFIQIPNAIRPLCMRNWANLAPAHGMS
jgi:transposase